ncbi:hypothetical protein AVEN_45054-1 [Araneus ventricosus]|uniref:Transposase Tc1-like domain-containing protein n=1 Tax=Araneus ventricosus TaxID=182803 RepID=A0A4Y2UA43_ARAVE|nr:hypothetical protein AVEN_45054-1 [Araneus ventricosus]
MLQFASSNSSAESEIGQAESMSRKNHLHHEMRRLWKHYQRDQNRRITTTADDRLPVAMCQTPEDTNSTTAGVAALCCCKKAHIRQTVSRRLYEGGLFARRPVVCVPLSPAHVRARLHWALEHRSWTPEHWDRVLLTDESRFNIQNDSRRAMI